MPVSDITPYFSVAAHGGNTYPFAFKIFEAAELVVKVAGVTKTLGLDYTVTITAEPGEGGNIVFQPGYIPALGSSNVEGERVMATERITDYQEAGGFRQGVVDKDFDRLNMMVQDMKYKSAVETSEREEADTELANSIASLAVGLPPAALSDFSTTPKTKDFITKGPWLDARAFTTLAEADAAAAAGGKTLVISTVYENVPVTLNAPSIDIISGGQLAGTGTTAIVGEFSGCAGCFGVNRNITGLKKSQPEMFVGDTGLLKAIAASNRIELSDTTYTPNSNLTLLDKTLIGIPGKSIIRPKAGVTIALTVNASSTVYGVVLDGTDTTGAKGLYVASNAVDDDIVITRTRSINFKGANAVGMHVNAAVNTVCDQLFLSSNQRGLLVDNASNSLPTTTTIRNSQISNNVAEGALVKSGQLISFPYTIFQSNGAEGLRVVPAGFAAFDINVDFAWFENNQTASGNRTSSYSMYVDGTSSGAVPVMVSVKGTHFGVGITSERALYINAAYYSLRDLEISIGDREQITIGASASGSYYGVPSSINPDMMINDQSRLMSHDSKWVAWTPTVGSDIGNSGATFVSAPTVTARYKLLGKTLHINVRVAGTLKVVTPTFISLSLPAGLTVVGSPYSIAQLLLGGTYLGGHTAAAGTTIYLQKFDNSAFPPGAAVTLQGSATFEVSY